MLTCARRGGMQGVRNLATVCTLHVRRATEDGPATVVRDGDPGRACRAFQSVTAADIRMSACTEAYSDTCRAVARAVEGQAFPDDASRFIALLRARIGTAVPPPVCSGVRPPASPVLPCRWGG